jgi:hypothetical protein
VDAARVLCGRMLTMTSRVSDSQTSHVSSFHFHEQYNTFQSMGYAAEPSGKGLVGDQESIAKNKGEHRALSSHLCGSTYSQGKPALP